MSSNKNYMFSNIFIPFDDPIDICLLALTFFKVLFIIQNITE